MSKYDRPGETQLAWGFINERNIVSMDLLEDACRALSTARYGCRIEVKFVMVNDKRTGEQKKSAVFNLLTPEAIEARKAYGASKGPAKPTGFSAPMDEEIPF